MDLGERYLELALRFRRIAPSLVEAYTGPAELAEAVEAEPMPSEPEVAERAAELRAAVLAEELEPARASWLGAQAAGIEAACNWLAGEPIGYRELVERCYGPTPGEVDPAELQQAHELILEALPGPGSAAERYQAWSRGQLVEGERLLAGFEALAAELGRRTRERWELPDGEGIDLEMVSDRPWAANADYQGALRTTIQINHGLPIPAWRMVELIAHEAYPGHHTEHVRKEAALVRGHGRTEYCVWVYTTPQALVAEGIAMIAPELLLGEEIEEVGAACLRPFGIDYDIAGSAAARRAHELLVPLRADFALRIDEGRVDRDGVFAEARRWMLEDDAYVARVVDNLHDSDWPPYESCYPEGLRLARAHVAGDAARFDRLLREQLTPAELTAPG